MRQNSRRFLAPAGMAARALDGRCAAGFGNEKSAACDAPPGKRQQNGAVGTARASKRRVGKGASAVPTCTEKTY